MLQIRLDDATMQGLTVPVRADAPSIILVQESSTTTAGRDRQRGSDDRREPPARRQTGDCGRRSWRREAKGGMPQLNPVRFLAAADLAGDQLRPAADPDVEGGAAAGEFGHRGRGRSASRPISSSADRVKAEADNAKAAYEKTLADARAKAQAELAAATQAIQAEIRQARRRVHGRN